MSSSKSVRTRLFATGGATAAIEGRDPSFSVHGPEASTNNTAANDNRHMAIDIERQPTGSVPSVLGCAMHLAKPAAHKFHPYGTLSRVSELHLAVEKGKAMVDDDAEIESSPLPRNVTKDGITVRVEMYRLVGKDERWSLEVVDH
jgi:hypothetical protein